jgi:hypothetical protein
VVSNFAEYLAVLLRGQDDVVLVNAVGPFDHDSHGPEVAEFVSSIDEFVLCIKDLKEDFATRGWPAIRRPALSQALRQVEEQAIDVYLNLIARRGRANEEAVQREIRMLKESGLQELFGSSPLALRAFASLSITLAHDTPGPVFYELDAQLELIKMLYLPDESVDEMRTALQGVLERDETSLLRFSTHDQIFWAI